MSLGETVFSYLKWQSLPPEVPLTVQEIVELDQWFGRGGEIEVEFGSGKGKFLIARADKNPEVNFIGLDWAQKWLNLADLRADRRNLPNVKFLHVHAQALLSRLPKQRVSIFHIYFPDPWPKRRHHERRLVQPSFLEQLFDCLKQGGKVELATDHADYYSAMKRAVMKCRRDWFRYRQTENHRIFDAQHKTNYELKYEIAGRPLYYLELEKA